MVTAEDVKDGEAGGNSGLTMVLISKEDSVFIVVDTLPVSDQKKSN